MKTNNEKVITVLNGLVEINNDRVDGYETAAKETDDVALKSLFGDFASDSRQFQQELTREVLALGGEPEKGTTTSGKFYRAWMDIKAAITAKNRKMIVGSCEFGEDVALETYNAAIKSDADLTPEHRRIIEMQREKIQTAHDRIKELRDTVDA